MGIGTKLIEPKKRGANANRLTAQQRVFVQELLNDPQFRPSMAAKKAGYSQPTTSGYKLMTDKVVSAFIGKELYLRAERAELSSDTVVRALANIAFFDIRKIFDEEGNLLNIQDIDSDTSFAIESIEVQSRTNEEGETTSTTKLKFHSKMLALELLAKHLGMLHDRLKVEHSGSVDIVAQLLSQVESKGNTIDSEAILLEAENT